MAIIVKDRVRETSATTGTGTLTLAGAVTGFQAFSVLGTGAQTYYCIVEPSSGAWEVGIGTVGSGTLSRDTVLESSSTGAKVNFGAQTKDVFCTYPAGRSVSQADVGTDPNQVPLNQYLGGMAYQNPESVTVGDLTITGNIKSAYLDLIFQRQINNIGIPGALGFGVGICPGPLPSGMSPLPGTLTATSDEYGNYQYSDGSIMVWIPAYFYKWGTGTNGLALNDVDVKPFSAFPDVATSNAAGYALHRAFYDGGEIKQGVFVDKYQCGNNGGIASSIKLGNPLSSAAANNPYSGLTGTPANNLGGSIAAAKTRGADFFCNSRFIFAALALLSYAHGRASSSTTFCAWYHPTNNFPKGNNNNALRDVNDTEVLYIGTGYSNAGKTGSANLFARTTHNGQNSGIADLNGNMWEFTPGLTSNGTNLYVMKTSVRMADVTGGNTLATDAFGATGIAALYDDLGTAYEVLWSTGADRDFSFGNATNQVFSTATSGLAWNYVGLGLPLAAGIGGTNEFGNDRIYDRKPNEMAPVSGGNWPDSSAAGVWALALSLGRTDSAHNRGFRSALYL